MPACDCVADVGCCLNLAVVGPAPSVDKDLCAVAVAAAAAIVCLTIRLGILIFCMILFSGTLCLLWLDGLALPFVDEGDRLFLTAMTDCHSS